jgi:uncharacterized protein (TIGR03435 family)
MSFLDVIPLFIAGRIGVSAASSYQAQTRQYFDLVAKVPAGATRQQFRVMLQNLLSERFRLKLHIESREFPASELVVAKAGLKLKEAVADTDTAAEAAPARQSALNDFPDLPLDRPAIAARNSVADGFVLVRLRARQEPLSELAKMLYSPGDRPILDKTGLTGRYDFTLRLQLVDRKAPFDVVIIESFDKLPAAN